MTYVERRPVDVSLALRQWERYVAALASAGWETVEAPAADDCADGVFVEDVLVVYDDVAVLTRPGVAERRAELAGIDGPGRGARVRGGANRRALPRSTAAMCCRSGAPSTSARAADERRGHRPASRHSRAARRSCRPDSGGRGASPEVRASALCPTARSSATRRSSDDPSLFPQFVEAPEESGAHVVLLGGDMLLIAADCPRSAELYAASATSRSKSTSASSRSSRAASRASRSCCRTSSSVVALSQTRRAKRGEGATNRQGKRVRAQPALANPELPKSPSAEI